MNDHYLFGQGGEESVGKVPVQVFVLGDDPTGRGIGEARYHLNQFLTNLRAGTLQQAWFRAQLSVGGEVRISHMFGETRVVVDLSPSPSEETTFYGGILLKPTYIANEATFFGSYVSASEPTTVLVDEVKSAGTLDGEGGRPAVPGTLTTDETDWLVVQIAGDKPLGATPLASGAVKIFRIKDPQFGQYVETNDAEDTYLLSASPFPSPYASGFGLEKFFLCGQRVLAIPPLVLTAGELRDISTATGQQIRIRTFGLQFDSFETASAAQGIVIVAVNLQLYVLDTRDPTWVLLDSLASFDNINDFGADFNETVEGDVTTIVCSGSNGAGVCSGFEVVVTEHSGGLPTFTGRLFPMADGSVAAGPATVTLHKRAASNATVNSTPASVAISKSYRPPDFIIIDTVTWSGVYSTKLGDTETHAQGTYAEGTPALTPDKFLGGLLPTYQQISYSFNYDWKVTFSAYASGQTTDPGGLIGPLFCPKYYAIGKTLLVESATLAYQGSYIGDTSRFTNITREAYGHYFPIFAGSAPSLPASTSVSTGSTYTFTGVLTLDPTKRFEYIGSDMHTDRLRMRREAVRTATLVTRPFEDTLRSTKGYSADYARPDGNWNPFGAVTFNLLFTSTPPQMPISLLRRGGEVAYSWADTLVAGATTFWQSTTSNVDSQDVVVGVVGFTQRGNDTNLGPNFYNSEANWPLGIQSVFGTFPPVVSDLDHTGGVGATTKTTGFVDYAAWSYPGGSIGATFDNPGDPGVLYNQQGGSLPTPGATDGYHTAATPWSVELTYPGTYPTVDMAYSDFATLFPMSKYATTAYTYNGPGNYIVPAKLKLPSPPFAPTIARGVLPPLVDRYTRTGAIILRDLRSGGFIAQMRVKKYFGNPDAIGQTMWHTHEVIIGNEYDSLPLTNVLDEWKALGENSGLSDGKHIFTQPTAAPALL